MVELDQFKFKLNQYREPMEELGQSLELDRKKARMEELEAKMEEPDFWSEPEKAQEITKELKGIKDTVEGYDSLNRTWTISPP